LGRDKGEVLRVSLKKKVLKREGFYMSQKCLWSKKLNNPAVEVFRGGGNYFIPQNKTICTSKLHHLKKGDPLGGAAKKGSEQ